MYNILVIQDAILNDIGHNREEKSDASMKRNPTTLAQTLLLPCQYENREVKIATFDYTPYGALKLGCSMCKMKEGNHVLT